MDHRRRSQARLSRAALLRYALLTSLLALPVWVVCGFDATLTREFVPDDDGGLPNAYACNCLCFPHQEDWFDIQASGDDGTEDTDGEVTTTRDFLQLDAGRVVGLRFTGVSVPPDAELVSAWVQFTAFASGAGGSTIEVTGEDADDAAPFAGADNEFSDTTARPRTAASFTWMPGAWTAGDMGPEQQADVTAIVQEIVERAGWASGSALALFFEGTLGGRTASAFDSGEVPTLHVVYRATGAFPNRVTTVANLDVCMPDDLNPNTNGGTMPTNAELTADCSGRVADNIAAVGAACGFPDDCECAFQLDVRPAIECNEPCAGEELAADCSNFDPENGNKTATHAPGLDPVCLVAASDPPVPVPAPLADSIYGRRSFCSAGGDATLNVPGLAPRTASTLTRIRIAGGPCPGGGCSIGLAYESEVLGAIEYDGGFLGEGDTTISEIVAVGSTLPFVATLDGSGDAMIPSEASLSTGRGKRTTNRVILSDVETRQTVLSANEAPLEASVDWVGKTCSLRGALFGGELTDPFPDDGEDPTVNDLSIAIDVEGELLNQPPQADAGGDRDVECTGPGDTLVTLDGTGTSDPDDNVVSYRWLQGSRTGPTLSFASQAQAQQGLGLSEEYWLRVVDQFAQASEDVANVSVVDTADPILLVPADVGDVECTGPDGTAVVLGDAFASDLCDEDVAITNDAPALFPVGTTVVTWTATDDAGNTTSLDQLVTVVDTTPPEITLSLAPDSLWPPSHKLEPVMATIEATDLCDPDPAVSLVAIASDEPVDGTGDGATDPDWAGDLGTDDREIELRSERKGNGDGRVYTVTYEVEDASGNTDQDSDTVSVSKSQGG